MATNYHLLDDKHIEILAGDIARGLWNFTTDAISCDGAGEVQLKNNTKSMEIRLTREVGRLDTLSELPVTGLVCVGLSLTMGPMGGLAGTAASMAAGQEKFHCIGCQLKDGRKFIAFMRASVFDEWCKACPDAKKIEKTKKKSGWSLF
jgi:hypothetical protein